MTIEKVILVDVEDNILGTMDKIEAHVLGKLHRAFSVFIFNNKGELLLQQRAFDKYHSGGKWTNTCCSHPRLGEDNLAAANRRLREEMGMSCKLEYVFNFTYKADLNDGIAEHELDHVFFGICDDLPKINEEEVAGYRYITLADLSKEIAVHPELYTDWLKICFNQVEQAYSKLF
ncbi:isopentenyl-diphosphate Delta-isomerase [Pedobacter sp. PWIIR3]